MNIPELPVSDDEGGCGLSEIVQATEGRYVCICVCRCICMIYIRYFLVCVYTYLSDI